MKEKQPEHKEEKSLSQTVAEAIEDLKNDGYDFEIADAGSELTITLYKDNRQSKREFRLAKKDPFPLKIGEELKGIPLVEAVKKTIVQPDAGLAEPLKSEQHKGL